MKAPYRHRLSSRSPLCGQLSRSSSMAPMVAAVKTSAPRISAPLRRKNTPSIAARFNFRASPPGCRRLAPEQSTSPPMRAPCALISPAMARAAQREVAAHFDVVAVQGNFARSLDRHADAIEVAAQPRGRQAYAADHRRAAQKDATPDLQAIATDRPCRRRSRWLLPGSRGALRAGLRAVRVLPKSPHCADRDLHAPPVGRLADREAPNRRGTGCR